jgi:hypothetical protein
MKMLSPLYSLKAWQGLSASATSVLYHVEGSGVFRRESSYTQLCRWYVTGNPRTSFQQANRSMWGGFSEAQKFSWEYYQSHRRRRPVMSGYNLFISRFMLTGGNPGEPEGP